MGSVVAVVSCSVTVSAIVDAITTDRLGFTHHFSLFVVYRWYCMACNQRNSGLNFPNCYLCGNRFSQDGIEGAKVLKSSMQKVRKALKDFIQKDAASQEAFGYSVKERYVSTKTVLHN